MIYYLYKTSKIDYKVWDVNTVTAADFTVEYNITEQAWENFKKSKDANQENLIGSFYKYIKTEFEKIV